MSYRNGCLGLAIIFIVSIYIWGFLYNPTKDITRFHPTGLNTHFVAQNYSSFDDYIHQTDLMVRKAHEKAHYHLNDADIFNNSPKELLPDPQLCPKNKSNQYDNGIVLIHGLFDSPYGMAQLGQFFQRHCFVVYVPLLPGHGTVVGDLLQVNFQDWINIVNFATIELSKKVNHVYLGGHSIGGLLAINQAFSAKFDIKGLILLAPALEMKTQLTPLISPLYWLSQWIPRLRWWQLESDQAPVRYESVPINPVYQTFKLMEQVKDQLRHQKLTLPVFIMQSLEDETINSAKTIDFFNSNHNSKSQLLLFSEKKPNNYLYDARTALFLSYLPTQNILSMSHLSLTVQMSDPIYGKNGEYKDCLYYQEKSPVWKQCKSGVQTKFGEVTSENVKIAVIQRLTFNPFYLLMLDKLTHFLQAS